MVVVEGTSFRLAVERLTKSFDKVPSFIIQQNMKDHQVGEIVDMDVGAKSSPTIDFTI